MTNAHSKTGQMAVCCQNLTLGALSSRSALSLLIGALFKKFGLFLNTPRTLLLNGPIYVLFYKRFLFWDVSRCRLVVRYRRFGTSVPSTPRWEPEILAKYFVFSPIKKGNIFQHNVDDVL